MATGDQQDIFTRIKAVLPPWFPDSSPILDAILYGWATTWAFVYALFLYARLQSRILTATDGWLDLIAGDFFGLRLQRRQGQTDSSYRTIIVANIFRERATRAAVIRVLQDITGRTPAVFEIRRPIDTGAYGLLYGYGARGGYGSLLLEPYACFVKAYRPTIGSPQYGLLDSDIYAAIDSVRANNTTIWTQILD